MTDVPFGAQAGTAYTDRAAYTDGVALPGGRAMGNGSVAAMIVALNLGVNGNGATRSFSASLGSASCSFSVGAGGTAPGLAGWVGTNNWFVNGGTARITVTPSGSMHFSHGGGGTSYDGYGTSYAGTVYGAYRYYLPPTAPTLNSVTSTASGSLSYNFSGSADDGGAGIETYRVYYSTSVSFSSASYIETTSGTGTITGLTPGVTYYVRVAARNAVTDAAGTVSAYSSTGSVQVLGGVRVEQDGAWVEAAVYAGINGAWVPCQVFASRGGAWVGLTD